MITGYTIFYYKASLVMGGKNGQKRLAVRGENIEL
jgi:hypothetical protein